MTQAMHMQVACHCVRWTNPCSCPPAWSKRWAIDLVECAGIAMGIATVDGIGDEVSQLEQSAAAGGHEERDIGHVAELAPAVAACPYLPCAGGEILAESRVCDDDQSALRVAGAVEPAQHEVEPRDDLLKAMRVRMLVQEAVLYHHRVEAEPHRRDPIVDRVYGVDSRVLGHRQQCRLCVRFVERAEL